jgi:hypothetical protein
MKKTTTLFAILFIAIGLFAQNSQQMYFQKMGETLGEYASCKTIADYNKLSNKFMQIAQVKTTEWLPLYYAANCKIMMSFMENEDKVKKDAYLDDAEKMIDNMILLSPNESEIFALEALMNTARLVVDPMTRGQEFTIKSNESAGKSLAINPKNPRAKYIMLSNKVGFAKFFGKEITAECEEANTLLANWDNFKVENPLAPTWGKNLVEGIVAGCE